MSRAECDGCSELFAPSALTDMGPTDAGQPASCCKDCATWWNDDAIDADEGSANLDEGYSFEDYEAECATAAKAEKLAADIERRHALAQPERDEAPDGCEAYPWL